MMQYDLRVILPGDQLYYIQTINHGIPPCIVTAVKYVIDGNKEVVWYVKPDDVLLLRLGTTDPTYYELITNPSDVYWVGNECMCDQKREAWQEFLMRILDPVSSVVYGIALYHKLRSETALRRVYNNTVMSHGKNLYKNMKMCYRLRGNLKKVLGFIDETNNNGTYDGLEDIIDGLQVCYKALCRLPYEIDGTICDQLLHVQLRYVKNAIHNDNHKLTVATSDR